MERDMDAREIIIVKHTNTSLKIGKTRITPLMFSTLLR